jgi:HSP20 family protein
MSVPSSLSPDWLATTEEGQLAVDLFRRGSTLVIRAALAGIEPDELSISVHDDLLTIRGERRQQEDIDHDDWFLRECYWGSFSRSVLLPEDVDEHGIEATMKQGILEIRLPIRSHERKIVVRPIDE